MRSSTPVLFLAVLLSAAAALDAQSPAERKLEEMIASSRSRDLPPLEAWRELKPRLRAFADEHRGSEAGLEALLHLLRGCRWERRAGTMRGSAAKLAEEMVAGYEKSPRLAKLADHAFLFDRKTRDGLLARLAEKSPHPAVRAAALFRRSLDLMSDGYGGMQRAYEIIETLKKKYAAVPYRHTTYGELADAYLEPHPVDALAVGKPAPEIEGTDGRGKPMKLSDFRGRVVVLEFWGHW